MTRSRAASASRAVGVQRMLLYGGEGAVQERLTVRSWWLGKGQLYRLESECGYLGVAEKAIVVFLQARSLLICAPRHNKKWGGLPKNNHDDGIIAILAARVCSHLGASAAAPAGA